MSLFYFALLGSLILQLTLKEFSLKIIVVIRKFNDVFCSLCSVLGSDMLNVSYNELVKQNWELLDSSLCSQTHHLWPLS